MTSTFRPQESLPVNSSILKIQTHKYLTNSQAFNHQHIQEFCFLKREDTEEVAAVEKGKKKYTFLSGHVATQGCF